jgi:hypothetical protein
VTGVGVAVGSDEDCGADAAVVAGRACGTEEATGSGES